MTKQEIYVKIGYKGEYTKEVKRRLRELIKKYHPDLNNGDDRTMKILNEVKSELENNRVDDIFYQDISSVVSEKIDDKVTATEDYFKDVTIEMLHKQIEKLKKEKEEEYDMLLVFDKKLNDLKVLFKKKLHKYEEEKNKIEMLNKNKIISDKKLFRIIVCILLVLMLIISRLFYSFNLYLLIFLLIFIFVSSIYFCYKYINVLEINKNISISYANKNTYFNDVMDKRFEIYELEKQRFKQYINYRNKADDMQLYYYELTKKNNKTVTYQKNNPVKK